jgi:hypothetical protein
MNELAVAENPQLRFGVGKDVANVCREIVLLTSVLIPKTKKKHVCVEGWQSIAAAWGCTPAVTSLEHEEAGVRAKAVLRRDSDGAILSEAFGYCGNDEAFPNGQLRFADRHAVEGMAQTRAISRVCANKFRFVVVLIDKELSSTPAEEMPRETREVEATIVPSPTIGAIQTLEGPLDDIGRNGEYVYGVVKGIRFSTKKTELIDTMAAISKGSLVKVEVMEVIGKYGKVKFSLRKLEQVLPPEPESPTESDMDETE